MIYCISGLHFGHAGAFRYDSRPFGSVEEIDRALNVGCMINHYMPVTFAELVACNQCFKQENP